MGQHKQSKNLGQMLYLFNTTAASHGLHEVDRKHDQVHRGYEFCPRLQRSRYEGHWGDGGKTASIELTCTFTKRGSSRSRARSRWSSDQSEARRRRPLRVDCTRRAALLPAPHSITSSARASNVGGTARPSAFAVLISSTSSAGLSPLRMRST